MDKSKNLIVSVEEKVSVESSLPATDLLEKSITRVEANSPKPLKPVVKLAHDYLSVPLEAVERKANSYSVLNSFHRLTKIPPIAIVGLISIVVLVTLRRIYRTNAHFFSNVVGVIYPAFSSILAIEAPNPDDDERWLTYWPVFGLFVLADHSASSIKKYFPYFTFKIAALYWLAHRNGALDVYRRIIRPILIQISKRQQKSQGSSIQTNNLTQAA
ncbi:ER membrane protein DP1/Yop1 [Nowakowskiella sp. JEL0407]|nr:ER membrane protein DP1/Yop1 [Nowakowskiella sp. JEL0407]